MPLCTVTRSARAPNSGRRGSRPGAKHPAEKAQFAGATDQVYRFERYALHKVRVLVEFALKHLEQWRLQEIADELNVKIDTVKQAIFRGVRKLRVSMVDLRSKNYA